jgi:hypothetical protein
LGKRVFFLSDGRIIKHDKKGITIKNTSSRSEENGMHEIPIYTDRLYERHDPCSPFLGYLFVLDWESTQDDFATELIRSGLYTGTPEERHSYEKCGNWEDEFTLSFYKSPGVYKHFTYACWERVLYDAEPFQCKRGETCRYVKFSPPSHNNKQPSMPARHSVEKLGIFGGVSNINDIEIPVIYFLGELNDGKILRLLHHSSRSEFVRSLERAGLFTRSSSFLVQTVGQKNGMRKYYAGFLDITDYIREKEIKLWIEIADEKTALPTKSDVKLPAINPLK